MARCGVCDESIANGLILCSNCEGNKLAIDATNNVIKEMAKLGGVPARLLPYYNPAPSGGSTAQAKPVSSSIKAANYDEAKAIYKSGDYSKAASLFKILSDQGNLDAMNYMGTIYWYGHGVEKNEKISMEWFTKAANLGFSKAQYNLFEIYNATKNYELAFEWLEKAAENGDSEAQFNVGVYLFFGMGIKENKKEAIKWIKKSADNGWSEAKKVINDLRESRLFNGYQITDMLYELISGALDS